MKKNISNENNKKCMNIAFDFHAVYGDEYEMGYDSAVLVPVSREEIEEVANLIKEAQGARVTFDKLNEKMKKRVVESALDQCDKVINAKYNEREAEIERLEESGECEIGVLDNDYDCYDDFVVIVNPELPAKLEAEARTFISGYGITMDYEYIYKGKRYPGRLAIGISSKIFFDLVDAMAMMPMGGCTPFEWVKECNPALYRRIYDEVNEWEEKRHNLSKDYEGCILAECPPEVGRYVWPEYAWGDEIEEECDDK